MNRYIWIINHYAMTPSQGSYSRHYILQSNLMKDDFRCKIFTSSAIHNSDLNMIEDNSQFKDCDFDNHDFTYIRTRSYGKSMFKRIFNLFDFYFGIARIGKKYEKPDAMFVSMPHILTGVAGIKLAKRLGVRCVVEVRDLWPESIVTYGVASQSNPIISILYQVEKWIYKHADGLVFTMEGGMDYIRDRGWEKIVSEDKVSFINNGCDLTENIYNKSNFIFEDKDLDSQTDFKVVYTGSIRKVNNVGQIVDCAKILKDSGNSNIKFFVFGEGNLKDMLIQRCQEENIDNVFFKGYVDKKYIPSILSKADINLMHSQSNAIFRYGYSLNKLFDYLASGKPMLSDIYCNPKFDLLLRYNCGITVKGNDAQALADGVLEFYNMPEADRAAYSERASEAAKDYDYKNLTMKLEKSLFKDMESQ